MKKIKVAVLYDKGSSQYMEDGFFAVHPFYGVLDGVSSPFNDQHPPKKFDGLTGGEKVARTVESTFYNPFAAHMNPITLIRDANWNIKRFQVRARISSDDPGELAGATFAIAKVSNRLIEIFQAGDGFALWVLRSGKIGITKNQVHGHDTRMNDTITSLQREIAKELFAIKLEDVDSNQSSTIRKEMWIRFYSILKNARREDINNLNSPCGYGLLNGQKGLESMIFKKTIGRDEIETLILFTDGIVPWESMKNLKDEEIAKKVYEVFKQGGLPKMLNVARGIEEGIKNINYTDSAEATAVALSFE